MGLDGPLNISLLCAATNNKLCQAKAKYTDGETDGYWIFDQIEDTRVKFPFSFPRGNLPGEELLHRQLFCRPGRANQGAR